MVRKQEETFLDKPVCVWLVSGLILFSVASFMLETHHSIKPEFRQFLHYSELVIVAIFTFEYGARIFLAKHKIKFIFSFYAVIDLLVLLTFYLTLVVDIRSLRLVRLLMLLRILKLTRYSQAMTRFGRALYLAKEELIIFSIASIVMIYIAAVGIYHFEHPVQPEVFSSIFDCLWWAVATLTTVGYGDMYPVTLAGRFFTFVILMVGLGMIAVPTGIISSTLSETREHDQPK